MRCWSAHTICRQVWDAWVKCGHPEVVAAIEHVTQVCQAAHMPLGIFGLSAEAVQPYIERGYTLITVGVDTVLMGCGEAVVETSQTINLSGGAENGLFSRVSCAT